ncbi:MAG: hypothetical protein K6C40_09270, partial [Thermoguttaceae bacterium]|nr:hypothetical protein [Thermoguttaceae bacterium]
MSEETHAAKDPSKSYKLASISIAVIIVAYIIALCFGFPQKGTQYIQEANGGHEEAAVEAPAPTTEEATPVAEEAPA